MQVIKNPLIDEDLIEKITNLHSHLYPKDHISAHFNSSLLREYYGSLVRSCECIYIAYTDGIFSGFCILGARNNFNINMLLLRNPISLLKLTPKILAHKLTSLINGKSKAPSNSQIRLNSIVASNKHGHGVGSNLLKHAIKDYKNCSIGLSVKRTNFKAINFYFKHGFVIENIFSDKFLMIKNPDNTIT